MYFLSALFLCISLCVSLSSFSLPLCLPLSPYLSSISCLWLCRQATCDMRAPPLSSDWIEQFSQLWYFGITRSCQGTASSNLKVNVLTSLAMTFIFHKWGWLCLAILLAAGDHYHVRMLSPLSHYLLIITFFSTDNACRNFHVIFPPPFLLRLVLPWERIWVLTPESPE